MKLRVILVCTLLLLAVPSFALPLCAHCDDWNQCDSAPGDIERCRYDLQGNCYTTYQICSSPNSQSTVLTDFKVASVEINRPAQECATVTTAPAPAEAPAPAVPVTGLK